MVSIPWDWIKNDFKTPKRKAKKNMSKTITAISSPKIRDIY